MVKVIQSQAHSDSGKNRGLRVKTRGTQAQLTDAEEGRTQSADFCGC